MLVAGSAAEEKRNDANLMRWVESYQYDCDVLHRKTWDNPSCDKCRSLHQLCPRLSAGQEGTQPRWTSPIRLSVASQHKVHFNYFTWFFSVTKLTLESQISIHLSVHQESKLFSLVITTFRKSWRFDLASWMFFLLSSKYWLKGKYLFLLVGIVT